MFPDVYFIGLSLYAWCIVVGIIFAFLTFRLCAERMKLSVKLQNTVLVIGFISIAIGFLFAILFQAFYDYTATGKFVIDNHTGMTFYGGLIGGAGTFLIGYFFVAPKICKEEVLLSVRPVVSAAACAIAIAHAFGRIGCFFAGCCYGKTTDSAIGIYLPAVQERVIPTQLIEAAFLFLLFAGLLVLLLKTKLNTLYFYMILYGVFRFILEFWRADDRGSSVIPALSPSQVLSILLVIGGVGLLVFSRIIGRKRSAHDAKTE